jgi:VanZ family protein
MSRRPWWIAFIVAALVQAWALYWPRPASVETGLPLDKVVHFALFFVVTYAGVRAGVARSLVAALMVGQALLSEAVQHLLLPQRSGDVWDLVADVAGITVALWVTRDRPHRVATVPDQL